jgi:hypothetical protein
MCAEIRPIEMQIRPIEIVSIGRAGSIGTQTAIRNPSYCPIEIASKLLKKIKVTEKSLGEVNRTNRTSACFPQWFLGRPIEIKKSKINRTAIGRVAVRYQKQGRCVVTIKAAYLSRLEALASLHQRSALDLLEWFLERAAIREYDGGYTRAEAERLALADIEASLP